MLQLFIFMCHSRNLWGLNWCRIILFWRNFITNIDIYASIFPWNYFKLFFQTKVMQFFKKYTNIFLAFRSLILKRLHLFNIHSPRSEILFGYIPPSLLSNSTIQINIGFLKIKLCPISHDDLAMDWFGKTNLYGKPHVNVSPFEPNNDTWKIIVRAITSLFTKFKSDARRESY